MKLWVRCTWQTLVYISNSIVCTCWSHVNLKCYKKYSWRSLFSGRSGRGTFMYIPPFKKSHSFPMPQLKDEHVEGCFRTCSYSLESWHWEALEKLHKGKTSRLDFWTIKKLAALGSNSSFGPLSEDTRPFPSRFVQQRSLTGVFPSSLTQNSLCAFICFWRNEKNRGLSIPFICVKIKQHWFSADLIILNMELSVEIVEMTQNWT